MYPHVIVLEGAKQHNLAQRVIQVKDIKAEFLSPSDHPPEFFFFFQFLKSKTVN